MGTTPAPWLSSGEHPPGLLIQNHQNQRVVYFHPLSFDGLPKAPETEKKTSLSSSNNTSYAESPPTKASLKSCSQVHLLCEAKQLQQQHQNTGWPLGPKT